MYIYLTLIIIRHTEINAAILIEQQPGEKDD